MYDVTIRTIKLPNGVKGATVTDSEGGFSVYVNSALPFEMQCLTAEHELNHIVNNHFSAEASYKNYEAEANNLNPVTVIPEYNRIIVK